MKKLQSKYVNRTLALVCVLFATAAHSAETAKPITSTQSSKQRHFIPTPTLEEISKIRESMGIKLIPVALTTRDARHPKALSKEWQQRITEATGLRLEYAREASGDTHIFKLPKKMIPAEAEEVAARIRSLPGILFAEPEVVGGGTNFAVPTDPLYSPETAKPTASTQSSKQRHFIPTPTREDMEKLREKIEDAIGVQELSVALTTRDAMHPKPLSKEWQRRISEVAGLHLEYAQRDSGDIHVFKLPRKMTATEAEEIASRIRAIQGILFAEPVEITVGGDAFVVPTDPLYSTSQWNLRDAGGGANLPPAWDITTGKNTLVVAVIDSGVLTTHPDCRVGF